MTPTLEVARLEAEIPQSVLELAEYADSLYWRNERLEDRLYFARNLACIAWVGWFGTIVWLVCR